MARVIRRKIQWDTRSTKTRFPWKKWTDGRIWAAKQGVDFEYNVRQFQRRLHSHASLKDLKVKTKTEKEGEVIFQFSKPSKRRKKTRRS